MTDPIRTLKCSACANPVRVVHVDERLEWHAPVLLALATPPASPEPERCAYGTPPDVCALTRDEHGLMEDPRLGQPHPFQPPTPPESAEALRDALLDQVHGRSRNRWYQLDRDTLDAIIAAARATPPLTVEALAKALHATYCGPHLGQFTHPGYDSWACRRLSVAILAALEQGR